MTEELQAKLSRWLSTSGHALEMRVAQAWEAHDIRAMQAVYYKDRDSDAYRETDVVAVIRPEQSGCPALAFFVIECKGQVKSPWLVLSAPSGLRPEIAIEQRAANHYGSEVLRRLSSLSPLQALQLFQLPSLVGYGLVQPQFAKRDRSERCKHDHAFQALMSVTKAAAGILGRFTPVTTETYEFVFPMLIVAAPLFQAFLCETGDVVVEPAEHCRLAWRNPVLGVHSFVDIATEPWFRANVGRLRAEALAFLERVTEAVLAEARDDA